MGRIFSRPVIKIFHVILHAKMQIALFHLCCYFTVSQAFLMESGYRLEELKQFALQLPLGSLCLVISWSEYIPPAAHCAPQHALE